jgi:hypothetical protein
MTMAKPTCKRATPTLTMPVKVRSSTIELRDGTKAKRGEVIQVPVDESLQTPATRWGLRTKNLVPVVTTVDLPAVTSTEIPEEE